MTALSELTYKNSLNRRQTEKAIDIIKTQFPRILSEKLNLFKVSCPLVIMDGTGINDDLNGIERPVRFPIKNQADASGVVVQSLAKWKRWQLAEMEVELEEGIITDMRALRPDEDYSPIHSLYVDQWDWEKRIDPSMRKLAYLKETVRSIYQAFVEMEAIVCERFPELSPKLPADISFIESETLLQRYPSLSPKEREDHIARELRAVFVIGIGGKLSNGESHDGRAPDYDDWSSENEEGFHGLNGDLLVWNDVLQRSFELSSMGIRVDAEALTHQLKLTGEEDRSRLFFHQKLLNMELPQSVGGGIGQSRTCMYLLRKRHIGEVQCGIWPVEEQKKCKEAGIALM
ncbi:Aspartate--ammonia ligase [Lunatimonas lonarensis]|uniref:Aspartate--ammonia ligase n=1 Tax=Lunatimonas lonarensis TaxID=1232681 RepID=R7ZZ42_9BACT|nr:aspartate--ammonia ligase [Lunatimonas lonarensis]EON79324.1 Aspartate--ammonia ligase [Lunatimonas lonarensis]